MPTINTHPISLSDQVPGTSVMFNVEANDAESFQWLQDGIALTEGSKYSGTMSASLTINNLVYPDDEGLYSVRVTNAAGTVTSTPAMLSISKYTLHTCSGCVYMCLLSE